MIHFRYYHLIRGSVFEIASVGYSDPPLPKKTFVFLILYVTCTSCFGSRSTSTSFHLLHFPETSVFLNLLFSQPGIRQRFWTKVQRNNLWGFVQSWEKLLNRPEAWTNNIWMLHHDNAAAHASLLIREFLTKHETTVGPQPSYSPDLAPTDFFFFPKLKSSH